MLSYVSFSLSRTLSREIVLSHEFVYRKPKNSSKCGNVL